MPRHKRPLGLALDPELMDELEAWIARQQVPPTKTGVIEAALREFLARHRERKK